MKILDEIMALDRAGMPVTYRDLLKVAEAVRELESAARCARSALATRVEGMPGTRCKRHTYSDAKVQDALLALKAVGVAQ